MRAKFLSILPTVAGSLFLIAFVAPAHASLMNFTFSFSNNQGSTSGTVTGLIVGLPATGTNVMAQQLFLETAPAGLGNLTGDALPINLTGTLNSSNNVFTTSGGQITELDVDLTFGAGENGRLVLNDSDSVNLFTLDNDSTDVVNLGGLSALTFSPTSAPEPASIALIGLAGGGLLLRRRSRSCSMTHTAS